MSFARISKVEKFAAVSFVWNLAGLEFAKKLITVARDQVVGFVSEPARQQLHDRGDSAPDSAQFCEYLNRSVGAGCQTFVGLRIVQQQVHRIQSLWVDSVSLEDIARELTLQSGKPEAVGLVALEDKLIEAIAESANTVIEDDRIGYRQQTRHPAASLMHVKEFSGRLPGVIDVRHKLFDLASLQ